MDSQTRVASENLESCQWPENSKWVADVLTEMDQNIQKMLKLIEENNESSTKHHEEMQLDSTASVKEFHSFYQTLSERYSELTRELLNNVARSDHDASSPVTPKGHLDLLESGRLPVSFSSGSGSSDISPNVDYDSSSSSSEFESELGTEGENLVGEEITMKIRKQMNHRELMKKIAEYEEELKTANLKLQDSENEIEKLKGEIEKSECAIAFADNLREELEKARREIELRDAVIGTEKRRVFELQEQVLELETKLSDLSLRIENLVGEIEVSRECLDVSDTEISKLREMLSDCQQNFSAQKERMETDITCLLEKESILDARVNELISHGELLEDQIKKSDSEKMEMRASFNSKEAQWEAHINALKIDLASRAEHIEALNKDFDKHKLRYDMLRAEKDGVSAEMENLKAELRSKDIQIGQMEEYLNQLQHKQSELVPELGMAKNMAEELKNRIKELERDVERQRKAISEGEEEKREAIRQLCFSLDHYRSGYRQLVRSISGKNKR